MKTLPQFTFSKTGLISFKKSVANKLRAFSNSLEDKNKKVDKSLEDTSNPYQNEESIEPLILKSRPTAVVIGQ